jgi:glycerophosphoryl diester phosphodiesterase
LKPREHAMIAISLALILAVPSEPAAEAAAKVKEVIGHMGSCADRPGNTLIGLRRAIEAGANASEIDARTTKDGVLVCMHDPEVDRTTNGKGKVADLSLAEIKKLDAGIKFDAKFKGEPAPKRYRAVRGGGGEGDSPVAEVARG